MIQTFLSIRLERRKEGKNVMGEEDAALIGAIICVGGTVQETSLVLNLK